MFASNERNGAGIRNIKKTSSGFLKEDFADEFHLNMQYFISKQTL